jgi:hypothetical protein
MSAYKDGLQYTKDRTPTLKQFEQHPVTNSKPDKSKGKDPVMPPVTRELPVPLKRIKQHQTFEAEIVASETRQRAGVLKE